MRTSGFNMEVQASLGTEDEETCEPSALFWWHKHTPADSLKLNLIDLFVYYYFIVLLLFGDKNHSQFFETMTLTVELMFVTLSIF